MKRNLSAAQKAKTVVAIDVGITRVGVAVWAASAREEGKPNPPCVAAALKIPPLSKHVTHKGLRGARAAVIALRWAAAELSYRDRAGAILVAEWPAFRAANAVGHAAASQDDLTGLAACAGVVFAAPMLDPEWLGALALAAPVADWKGQLPKKVVNQRLERAIGSEDRVGTKIHADAWDATGIGLWVMGYNLDDSKWFSAINRR